MEVLTRKLHLKHRELTQNKIVEIQHLQPPPQPTIQLSTGQPNQQLYGRGENQAAPSCHR